MRQPRSPVSTTPTSSDGASATALLGVVLRVLDTNSQLKGRLTFVLVLKRLTEDKFRWPRRQEAVVTLTTEQLHWILDGIDIDAMVRHPVRQYQVAG
jgi:hypothetical protein